MPTNKWCHVILWHDGASIHVIVDGVVVGKDEFRFQITEDVDLDLGYWVVDRARYFRGAIDDVVLYDRAIDSGELTALIEWAWAGYQEKRDQN